jgi:hypothetical protein
MLASSPDYNNFQYIGHPPFFSTTATIGLGLGFIWLTVIFDPVQLWNSPTSQTRKEKEYFDSTFRPFYRATQIIVKANDRLDFVSILFFILVTQPKWPKFVSIVTHRISSCSSTTPTTTISTTSLDPSSTVRICWTCLIFREVLRPL